MGLSIYKIEEYDHTHERQQFRELCNILSDRLGKTNDHNLLFANINFNGIPLDALLVKKDAIIVLEFKNYGGKVIATENGDWQLSDGTIIKGGLGKNPFVQVRNNKFATIDNFNTWFPHTNCNLYHTSGVVVFNQDSEIDDSRISAKAKTWFHITDMKHIGDLLEDITSAIYYTNDDLDKLPIVFNCASKLISQVQGTTQQSIVNTQKVLSSAIAVTTDDLFTKVHNAINKYGFTINYEQIKPEKKATYYEGIMDLGKSIDDFIKSKPDGWRLYNHQYLAAKAAKDGHNVCIATSTSSGKTAIFHMSALELLEQDPKARILAIYPMKALGKQQESEWKKVFSKFGCGRIDGSISKTDRLEILKNCQIVTITPDTLHTFLLGALKDTSCNKTIKDFLRNLKLVIIDEVHLYKGMLGSNSAYLFRRLNSCIKVLTNKIPQYITASATIADPEEHSKTITGISDNWKLIGPDKDSSFSAETDVILSTVVGNDRIANFLKDVSDLNSHSIAFFDSRKEVSELAMNIIGAEDMADAGFYPFKANMEDTDYQAITEALGQGKFKGVISTSSLEVGIDIKDLDIAILYGVPVSSTSLYQRMGRVGRNPNKKAVVIIINDPRSLQSKLVFNNPAKLFSLPLEEPALYLDNKNLQNVQALHFVDTGEEFESAGGTNDNYAKIESFFPDDFNILAKDILNSQYPTGDYTNKQNEGGGYPETVFTIISFGAQFNTIDNAQLGCGQLTMQNILREAYPDAIYNYMNRQYRVTNINTTKREIQLSYKNYANSKIRFIRTKPTSRIAPIPQKASNVYEHIKYGDLDVINIDIREFTTISGYKEQMFYKDGSRSHENRVDYPSDHYKKKEFNSNVGTTGVIFFHPGFANDKTYSLICTLLYNCFLNEFAFERADIEHGQGKIRFDIDGIKTGTKFITIYDKNEGGLNITQRLMDRDVLLSGFKMMKEIVDNGQEEDIIGIALSPASKATIDSIYKNLLKNHAVAVKKDLGERYAVAEGSKAIYVTTDPNDSTKEIQEEVAITFVSTPDPNDRLYYYDIKRADGTTEEGIPELKIHPIPGVSYKAKYAGHKMKSTKELW